MKPMQVYLETALGRIVCELYPDRAPLTVANFLRYVDAGYYNGGTFYRTVTPQNQPQSPVKIEVIQGGAFDKAPEFAPIPLERTHVTGVKHIDGALSMARDTPDSATSAIFICVGAQPELDFGGKRNPDGQGFGAFGRAIRGMDVVRRIQRSTAKEQQLTPPIVIRRADRI